MSLLGGVSDFFGLDIGTTALRAVQLRGTGASLTLDTYGQLEAEGSVNVSDAAADRKKVGDAVNQLIKEAGISTKNVAVNLPSQRVFTTIIDMPKLPPEELAKTIHLQADSFIPTPVEESKIDWAVLGDSPKDASKVEILLSSTPNKFAEDRLDMLETIGLNVIAIEPDNMALARAIVPAEDNDPQLILDVGHNTTDLVIVSNGAPRLSRAMPTGINTLVRAVAQNMNIDSQQAQQFVLKFGLGQDKLEGKVFASMNATIENLMAEVEKSIKFFEDRYNGVKLKQIIATGGASAIPEFPLFVANHFGLNVAIGNAWRNVNVPADRQDELMAISNHFAVAVGLAERTI